MKTKALLDKRKTYYELHVMSLTDLATAKAMLDEFLADKHILAISNHFIKETGSYVLKKQVNKTLISLSIRFNRHNPLSLQDMAIAQQYLTKLFDFKSVREFHINQILETL